MVRLSLGVLGLLIAGCGARSDLDQPWSSGTVGGNGAGGAKPCVDEDIASDDAGASALAVDGDVVFWVTNDGHLMRHDTSGNTQLASDYYAKQIALDATYVYGVSNGALEAIPRAGGEPLTLAQVAGALVLIDDTLYVATYAADLGGSVVAVHTPGQPPNPVTIIDGLAQAEGLAVDATRVYVTATSAHVGSQVVDHPVLAADRTRASSEQTPTVLATTAGWSFSLALDDDYVYFPDAGSSNGWIVFAVPKLGGAPLPVIDGSGIGETPFAVAVDSSGVYAITDIDPALYEIRRGGIGLQGPAPDFVEGDLDESFASIRTTSDAVYWTIQWGPDFEKPRAGVSLRKKCK